MSFAKRDADAMGALLDDAVRLARRWTKGSSTGSHPIFPDVEGKQLDNLIREPLPKRGLPANRLMRELEQRILPFMRDNGSSRFFGYVMSPPSSVGVTADLITSALDQNVTAWRSAPAATEIERLVVDWLRQIAGLPTGAGGQLTSGGSMATFTALATARARHAPASFGRRGMAALGKRMMTLYASDQVHMSVPRAVQLMGLGTDAIRTIPSDARYRIDLKALDKAIRDDKAAGHLPFCITASAGTVNSGAVDPLGGVARIAGKHGLWLHVDAAYGGPLRMSRKYRRLLAGLGQADSIAFDPHKWLYAPLDVGCVLFKDAEAPRGVFSTPGEYAAVLAPGDRESHIFFDSSPELSRRFRALKVWMILKYHGADRLGRRIEMDADLARELGRLIRRHPETELLAPVETSIVCFRYVPRKATGKRLTEEALNDLNRQLVIDLQADGRVYVTNARINGRFALRACLINFRTTPADLRVVIKEVVARGRQLFRMPSRKLSARGSSD